MVQRKIVDFFMDVYLLHSPQGRKGFRPSDRTDRPEAPRAADCVSQREEHPAPRTSPAPGALGQRPVCYSLISVQDLPKPASEYGYTLRQVEGIVGAEQMPAIREHMLMNTRMLDGPDGEIFYSQDILQFVEAIS